MARWPAKLSGERSALEQFLHWFADWDIFVIEDGQGVFLSCPACEALTAPRLVLDEATLAVGQFSGIISILCPGLRKPTVSLCRERDDGRREQG
jgi:hypothetical protein